MSAKAKPFIRWTKKSLFLILFLACVCCWIAQAEDFDIVTSPDVYENVSKDYYAACEQFLIREARQTKRSGNAMWDKKPRYNPREATGYVTDRFGVPISGARIEIRKETKERILGKGTTDKRGYFRIVLQDDYNGLMLTVLANGYERWALTGLYGGLEEYSVRLSQEINREFLDKLISEQEPEQRLRMLLEIVGTRQMGSVPVETIFPYLGILRDDLRGLLGSGQFNGADDRHSSPAKQALAQLGYWCDPVDAELCRDMGVGDARWDLSPQGQARETADTVEGILKKHVSIFDTTGYPKPEFSEVYYSLDGKRALVEASVLFAYWGYTYYLVMARKGEDWYIACRFEGKHMDFY